MARTSERRDDTKRTKNPTKISQKAAGTVKKVVPRRKAILQPTGEGTAARRVFVSSNQDADARRLRVLQAAKESGLLEGPKDKQLGGRFPRGLIEEAKRSSGLTETTELLTYALTKVALEDNYGEKLLARKGRIPKGILVVDD